MNETPETAGFTELSEIWIVTLDYVEAEDFVACATLEEAQEYARLTGGEVLDKPVKLYTHMVPDGGV